MEVAPAQVTANNIQQLMASVITQAMEQAVNVAQLNLSIKAGGGGAAANPDGVGQLLDVVM